MKSRSGWGSNSSQPMLGKGGDSLGGFGAVNIHNNILGNPPSGQGYGYGGAPSMRSGGSATGGAGGSGRVIFRYTKNKV